MPQVARAAIKERAARLRAVGDAALAKRLRAEVGATRAALVERPGFGRTEHYCAVALDGGEPGEVVPLVIQGASMRQLTGAVIRAAA
jgi:threonylcarbamoyladenosine tRNA methylthiotransferase MtaB